MSSIIDFVPALMRFGLTEYEARIYATLAKTGSKTAGELSFLSGVPRTKLYGSVRGLERKGLVKLLHQKPETFEATSPNDILFPLAEKLIKEAEESLEKVQNLSLAYESMKLIAGKRTPLRELSIIEGRQKITDNIINSISRAQESVDIIATANGMVRLYKSQSKAIERAMARGVKVRLITQVTSQNKTVAKEIATILQFRSSPKIYLHQAVFDSSDIILYEAIPDDMELETGNDVAILSQNPQIIESFKRLYDLVWGTLPTASEP
ncbi:TrmB family transcriptional regulator [[Eubacterium] cellulosolvens]